MSHPLFRTLQIGSLRYWGSEVEVIRTQVFGELTLEVNFQENSIEPSGSMSEILLQPFEISIESEKEFDLVLEADEIIQEGGCL